MFTLTVNVSPNQGGKILIDQTLRTGYPVSITVPSGKSVTLEAIPAEGYEFTSWSGGLDTQENPTTLLMDCNESVTANFFRKESSLTIEMNGAGSVSPSVGIHSYTEGTVVTITATPDPGYYFNGWTGGVDDASSTSTTVTIDSAKTVTAIFSRIYTLTIKINGSGSINLSGSSHSYTEGTVVDISATPDTGYRFDGWTGKVGDAGSASTMVIMDSDKSVIANFSEVSEAKSSWLPLVAIIIGCMVVAGCVIWLIAKKQKAQT